MGMGAGGNLDPIAFNRFAKTIGSGIDGAWQPWSVSSPALKCNIFAIGIHRGFGGHCDDGQKLRKGGESPI